MARRATKRRKTFLIIVKFELLYHCLLFFIGKNKSVNFRSLQFDSLRFWTTLLDQISTNKAHAIARAQSLVLGLIVLKVSSFQQSKFLAICLVLNMSGNGIVAD